MTLGETIARLRGEKNMSQGDLADALDVSRQSVSKWETNGSVPELGKLVQMSELFGVSLDELVKGEAAEKAAPEPPVQTVAVERPARDTKKIVGVILLCFGAAVALLLLALDWGWFAPIAAAPLFICGVICLTARERAGLKCAWAAYLCADLFLRFSGGSNWTALHDILYMRLRGNTSAVEDMVRYALPTLVLAAAELAALLLLLFFTARSYRNEVCEPTKRRKTLLIIGWPAYLLLRLALPYPLAYHHIFDRVNARFGAYIGFGRFVILYQIYLYVKSCAFLALFAWLLVTTLGVWRWKRAQKIEGGTL